MQYILTEQEYLKLSTINSDAIREKDEIIQKLCTEVADHKPIKVYWSDTDEPWKCIITLEKEDDDSDWYCDDCPVSHLCPYEYQSWSK